jgi:nucleotide-binding universal stress UspA family protein
MFGADKNWLANFQNAAPAHGVYPGGPIPNGISGIFLAMGLTFVAFEGYEIIAQSGEELKKPKKNLPRAIFLSIGIAVLIYLLVAFVSIGALVQDSGLPNWVYLGREGEKAMIRIAQSIMPLGMGAIVMILGGLASTTSALNATIYSSSRVSFAMGRGNDLPGIFGRIHRTNRTPHIAIYTSGVLIILFATLLPIQDVASGASLTFLILFILVNISLIKLRKSKPDLPRSFRVPLVPWLPIFAAVVQGILAITLFHISWLAWASAFTWGVIGLVVYRYLGGREEAALEADTILLEETIAKRSFSLLLPVSMPAQARQMARIAATIAHRNNGEIFALHVVRVPQQLSLSDGREFLKHGRPLLEEVVMIGKEYDVPVRTQLRLGRDISKSIMTAARERSANLILLGWPGTTDSVGPAFGSIIGLISTKPPTDLAVVRFVRTGLPKRILVPVVRNRNSKLALDLALSQAEYLSIHNGEQTQVVALHLVPKEMNGRNLETRQRKLIDELALDQLNVDLQIQRSENVIQDILVYSEDFDQIVIGAPEERMLEQQFFGSVPQKIAEDAIVNVIMVKRYDPIKHGLVRRWIGKVPPKKSYGAD